MSDCALPNGRWSAPTHSPDEDALTVMAHFTDGSERPCTMNRMGRTLDYLESDGERYERVSECELNPIIRHVDDVACMGFKCSLCHRAIYTPGEGLVAAFHGFDFCPLCGAKVKVGE